MTDPTEAADQATGREGSALRRGGPGRTSGADRRLETMIGIEVRALRRQKGMRIADLSAATGISISMLSKIENGVTSPSLGTLQSLGAALSAPLTVFFRSYDADDNVQPSDASSPAAAPAQRTLRSRNRDGQQERG